MKIYYAHPICLYGSIAEQEQLSCISTKFENSEIINPAMYPSQSMEFYLELVEKSDIVVFSCLLGKITSGVGKEINHALKNGKEVYKLNEGIFHLIKLPVSYMSRQATVNLYEQWWSRKELNT